MDRLGLRELFQRLGINGPLSAAAAGSIIGRLAAPASERATHRWLRERSGLGELLGVDFETMGAMQLYRASDALMAHRDAIESHLFEQAMSLFDLRPTSPSTTSPTVTSRVRPRSNPRRSGGIPRTSAGIVPSSPWDSCSMAAASSAAPRSSPAT